MAKKQSQVPKAQGKPLTQAYLILSDKKVEFVDRITLVDLFFPDTQMRMPEGQELTAAQYKTKLAQLLWTTLMERGFRLNSNLETQYQKQQSCIWCGGAVITYGTGTDEMPGWETRCSECNYLYDED